MDAASLPLQFVLLGGGGDLAQHKLLPALFHLFIKQKLGADCSIIGVARTPRTNDDYRAFVTKALHSYDHSIADTDIAAFCERCVYVPGSFTEPDTFAALSQRLHQRESELGTKTNRLFYLAVPPQSYETILTALHDCDIAQTTEGDRYWSRILVEKPFGKDLKTAQALDALLSSLYKEEQLYRIDHYLAKEAVQNLLSFRFANMLMKDSWNRDSIESVTIKIHETKDVSARVQFYDGIGALRDVGQNHILQLIALIAMEEPASFTPEAIRTAREQVLQALTPLTPDTIQESVVRAQYLGYKDHAGVPTDSTTETFFALRTEIDLPTWHGVPFYITAGKAMHEAEVSVTITLKDVATSLCDTNSCLTAANQIRLTISPTQTMQITLNAKALGLGYQLESRTLTFTCEAGDSEITNAYEKVLYDCVVGDQTLFTTTTEVLAAWQYITPILAQWHTLPLLTYTPGSTGPKHSVF